MLLFTDCYSDEDLDQITPHSPDFNVLLRDIVKDLRRIGGSHMAKERTPEGILADRVIDLEDAIRHHRNAITTLYDGGGQSDKVLWDSLAKGESNV